ncbi:retron St85 family RNA-directed DNA polymerase [Pedobacter nyackensis]|uniref:retron St85 family RNA-directed DNA polymerase n=1 Tax=Pedobacter nyackensis TaxID=475255 RepID=UPI00292D8B0B|nr:retron St85 family RNA-directed DNA polymerase [Pedobacter nyackensis]
MNQTDTIKLKMLGLPVIRGLDDFSALTHVSKYTIFQLSQHSDKHYLTYQIPKKSGKLRQISQPSKKLKGLQSWILVNLLNKLKVSNSCKGFEKGSSTLQNAEPHKGATCVINMDILDFFPTVSEKHVYNIFNSIGYGKLISTILTKLCVHNGALPQGGPCSPKLANLATWQMDARIQGYVGKRGINYTRYADDLSFSGISPVKVVQIIPVITKIINDEKFQINKKKTRVSGSSRAKVITGLTISGENVGIGKDKYKKVRAKIHKLAVANEPTNMVLLYEINGWIAYMNSVDHRRMQKARKYVKDLSIKYPDSLVPKISFPKVQKRKSI